MSAAYRSSSGFPDSSDDVTVVKDEIVEENAPSDLCYLRTKNDRGLSGLPLVQALCPDYDPSVQTKIQAVQVLLKEALAAFGSSRDVAESLVEYKKYESSRAKLEALRKEFES